MRHRAPLPSALAAALLGAAAVEAATPPSPAPATLELLARQVEAAVSRVSGSAQELTGTTDRTRAAYVAGLGIVIVLPARALPPQHRPLSVRSRGRDQQAEAPAAAEAAAPPAAWAAVPGTPRGVDQLQRELEHELAVQVLLLQAVDRAQNGDDALLRRVLQLQMWAIQEQAEAFRVAVERARERAERDVWTQLQQNQHTGAASATAPPQGAAPAEPAGPALPGEPPWRVWMSAPPEAAQVNQALVEQVREAMIGTLEAHGDEVRALAPQEYVTVAVDFVGAGPFALRPRVKSTLVVRAGAADVQARAAGKISAAEFRQRVQVRQY